jgi:two-component system cell cycle response regulator
MSLRAGLAWLSRSGRIATRLFPAAAVLLTFAQLARGGFRLGQLGWYDAAAVIALLSGIAIASTRALHRGSLGAPRRLEEELELGGSLIAAAYIVVAAAGPLFFPIVYLLLAFLVSFLPRASGLALLGLAVVFDGVMTLGHPTAAVSTFATHAVFLLFFAALYHVVLSARLAAARKAEREAVKKRIEEVEERARTFRLVSAGTQQPQPGEVEREKWLMASVKEIEGAFGSSLEIAEAALRTQTCAAFLLSPDDRFLKLYDCRSLSDRIQREKFSAGEGILGGVLKRVVPVRMNAAGGLRGVTYYESRREPVCSLVAAPIVETSGILRGVLVADRRENEPFSETDEKLLVAIACEVLRSIELERVMGYIRKARDEKDRFFRAIEELNRAGSPDQVFLAVLESARLLAGLDFCAVTLVAEEGGQRLHRIVRVAGSAQTKALEGRSFPDNNGLVANAVRYGTPLPGREIASMERQVIFDGEAQVRGLAALKIFPLIAGDRIVGTLVAGSRKKSALDDDVLRMIEVIAIQAAQAVLRAQLFEQMEKMAITDSLTSLLNRRAFQARVDEALAQARRYRQKCSFIMADIDHFKAVNDSYGHSTGDSVLKGVARIIREKARDADIVARFGGEEFAIAMPQTETRGAEVIAERIREAVMSEVFQTELGPLKVTLSLGIATYPDHGEDRSSVIDLADQSLYHAKKHGRNQSVAVGQMRGRKRPMPEAVGS